MSELIPFSQIDEDDSQYTEDQIEAADFLSKMDWEGGIDGLIQYGGASYFPTELQELAGEYELAYNKLSAAINQWAADRGVVY